MAVMGAKGPSIVAHLRNKARRTSLSHQLLLQLFCQEEFLRRLGKSTFARKLVLKGGLLLYAVSGYESRPTKDVDFLMRGFSNEPTSVRKIIKQITSVPGAISVSFEVGHAQRISEQRDYHGVRVKLTGCIASTRTPFYVDVGIGDVVVPTPKRVSLSPLLAGF